METAVVVYNPKTNVVSVHGDVLLDATANKWTWVFDFSGIDDKYKPTNIFNINNDKFQVSHLGYIQTISTLEPGNYNISCSWLAK